MKKRKKTTKQKKKKEKKKENAGIRFKPVYQPLKKANENSFMELCRWFPIMNFSV